MTTTAQTLTVRVALAVRRRGRKVVVTPAGVELSPVQKTRADPSLVKALARAHRWKRLLENGTYASISELAAAEKIDRGYAASILRLTLLGRTSWKRFSTDANRKNSDYQPY